MLERFVQNLWAEEPGNAVLDWLALSAGVVLLSAALFGAATFEDPTRLAEAPAPAMHHADT
ncbi:hypothetical protein [Thalassorhabdomicrobium marinisediminis]|uniref:hypothetical protein n=1 Tax=Thalassorhabdomicrobium marinisediminis TaxID=2170577 RepID=UPI00248F4705|nr:hypothetical protein [Thalassorhabdomicrobium marinisediminis]